MKKLFLIVLCLVGCADQRGQAGGPDTSRDSGSVQDIRGGRGAAYSEKGGRHDALKSPRLCIQMLKWFVDVCGFVFILSAVGEFFALLSATVENCV